MTISYVGEGTAAIETGDSSPGTVTYPTTAAGEKLLMMVFTCNLSETPPTTLSGWDLVGSFNGGEAVAVSLSNGPRGLTVWEKEATGSESGTIDITWDSTGGGAVFIGQIHRFAKTEAAWAATTYATGEEDTDTNTFVAVTGAVDFAPGDMVIGFGGICTDATLSTPAFSASGITFDTVVEQQSSSTTGGSTGAMDISTALVTAGTATTAGTLSLSVGGDAASGPAMFIRLREAAGGGISTAWIRA
jgi:hypothetical protein